MLSLLMIYLGKGVADEETATKIYKLLLFLHFHLPGDTILVEQASHFFFKYDYVQTQAPLAITARVKLLNVLRISAESLKGDHAFVRVPGTSDLHRSSQDL